VEKLQKVKTSEELKAEDPYYGLKFIAWCRSQLPPKDSEITEQDFVEFAKWQICKDRKVLFLDPIWDRYGPEDVLVEFFTIALDNNEELRKEFEATLRGVSNSDLAWFEEMEAKFLKQQEEKAKKEAGGEDEFEDKF